MGWVSIFDPVRFGALTARNPWPFCASARFRTFRRPQLEIDRWTLGRPLSEFVSENGWAAPAPA